MHTATPGDAQVITVLLSLRTVLDQINRNLAMVAAANTVSSTDSAVNGQAGGCPPPVNSGDTL
jgi:hypothetical protein